MKEQVWGQNETTGYVQQMKLQKGDNQVRIVSAPIVGYIHWCKTVDDKIKKLTCLGRDLCPVCKALEGRRSAAVAVIEAKTGKEFKVADSYGELREAKKAENPDTALIEAYETVHKCQDERGQRRNVAYVIDRTDGTAKILEFGATVRDGINELAKDADYGDPAGYDIKIKKTGEGRDTKYTVVPGKPSSLTPEEEEAVTTLTPLMTLYAPKTIDEVHSYGLVCLVDDEIPV